LHAALDVASGGPLTLVTGGPGWGKTQLVASWAGAAAAARRVAWLTLDADDDDPRSFWTYVLAALGTVGVIKPDNPLASLDPVGGLTTATHRQIQVGLSQLSHDVVLVLDDVSEVQGDEIHDHISRLFQHRSPLHLVLVGRAEPPLPLHRLRVTGDLAEIRAPELAFTAGEATELLVRHGPGLHQDDVAQLLGRTDGWAAGLRLAAMYLRRPDARPEHFGGAERTVADYLLSEVVADQSPQTWQFLLRTSLVSRVCGDLADALTGQRKGQATLDLLERDNAFVTALGPERVWYRYHPLLIDMLQEQIRLERPESVGELHERAATWFAENGQPVDAVRHAVRARNWPLVGTLFTNNALHRLQTTDRHALAAALAQVPVAELARTPELQLSAAGLRMVEGRYAEIGHHLTAARQMIEADPAAVPPATRVAVSLFECVYARARGSADGVVAAATSALDTLDQHPAAVPLGREWRAIASNNKGVGLVWLDQLGEATSSLDAGLRACAAVDVELTMVNALGHLGLVAALTGHLQSAGEWALRCRSLAEARGWETLPQAATGYLALGLVSRERNDLDEADQMLTLGLATQRAEPEPLTLIALRLAQVSVMTARGRYEDARRQIELVPGLADGSEAPRLVQRMLMATRAELDLATGNAAAVRTRLGAVPLRDRSDEQRVLLARACLADGVTEGLDDLVAPVLHPRGDLRLRVHASIVRALVADRRRLDNAALEALDGAVADAEPEQLMAPFSGPGTARLPDLLEHLVLLRPARAAFARALLHLPESGRPATDAAAEPVTERERTVLRYLATMLSNAEIAEQMYVSPNTVKVHLQHVYRKLGVTSRRAAVRRARELGLLESD
jgi:LuxR family maltose regulon positive regulatory protein